MMNGNNMAPVSEGEELDVRIEAIGEKGDGIAKKNGFVLVVPGTQINDSVRVKVTKVLRKVGFAEVIGKAEAAPKDEDEKPAKSSKASKGKRKAPQEEELEEESEPAEDSEDFGDE
jgi:predicted RNA-binding protein with TRAM domain